jgi:tetraacyldisaccharide 4'-kinase
MSVGGLDGFARRWWAGELRGAGALLSRLLAPAELTYRAGISLRNRGYDRGLLRVHRVGVPVISVGNLAVGGTGKTPFAHWLAMRLKERGHVPAVLHGGYAEDEPELHRRWSPDIAVIVERDRVAGARRARQAGATVVVLDDAFQHRRLHRDLDIVLVAAERWQGQARLLPRGPWREPRGSLRRAGLVVCTRKRAPAAAAATAAAEAGAIAGRPVVRVHLRRGDWRSGSGTDGAPAGPVLLVAALAEPAIFNADARAAGADVADTMTFPDHHAYTDADGAAIRHRSAGRMVVTTEKDWTKLDRLLDPDRTWLLTQHIVIEAGGDALDAELDRVLA